MQYTGHHEESSSHYWLYGPQLLPEKYCYFRYWVELIIKQSSNISSLSSFIYRLFFAIFLLLILT